MVVAWYFWCAVPCKNQHDNNGTDWYEYHGITNIPTIITSTFSKRNWSWQSALNSKRW